MYSLGVRVESHVICFHKVSKHLIIGSNHPAGIEKVKIGDYMIELKNVVL